MRVNEGQLRYNVFSQFPRRAAHETVVLRCWSPRVGYELDRNSSDVFIAIFKGRRAIRLKHESHQGINRRFRQIRDRMKLVQTIVALPHGRRE